MERTDRTSNGPLDFFAVLSPHRSLSHRGFLIMMGIVSLISLAVGLWFFLLGAWPVIGFFGLDVGLLYLAFKASYQDGKIFETVELTPDHLFITHHPLRGQETRWQFNPYWVKLQLLERQGKCCLVEASSHGKRLVFANFLSDDEKRDFTKTLNQKLATLRIG